MGLLPDGIPTGPEDTQSTRPKMPPELEAEVMKVLEDMIAVMEGTGKHAEHERKQVGRCVYCSCGARVQGTMAQ